MRAVYGGPLAARALLSALRHAHRAGRSIASSTAALATDPAVPSHARTRTSTVYDAAGHCH